MFHPTQNLVNGTRQSVYTLTMVAKDIQALEKVQRRAARWVMSDYSWSSRVTIMLDHLGWPTLSERHLFARLSTFYKIVHHLSAPQLPS